MKKPTLFGKYLLLERINVGGMAEVFTAKAFGVEGFERILAIKKILPTMAEDEEFITMFIDEARISVQLNHANVVHIHELGKHEDTYFIAMEYVAGRDLRTLLERYRRRKEIMPTAQAVFIASKLCEGLDYAHRKKDARGQDLCIIHRDVSPQNILVSYEGEVKIIDFGIAKAANRSQKTQAGILKGKFGYMSPEQVRGMQIDRRSDIFAVGVILYEMLTGEKLFVGESDFSTLEKVRNAEVPLPRQFNPNIPAGLEKVLLKALTREPEERYQWASDLQEDLMRFLLAGDAIYSSKHLSVFMKEVFAEDILREAEKMERYSSIERPGQIENSGVTGEVGRRRTQSLPSTPAVGRSSSYPSQPAAAPYIPPPTDDELAEMEAASDKTQIVDSSHSDDEESGRASSVLVDDSVTGETENPVVARKGRGNSKPKVVIGEESEASSGATFLGPDPSARPVVDSGETRVGEPSPVESNSTMLSPIPDVERTRRPPSLQATAGASNSSEFGASAQDEEDATGPIPLAPVMKEPPPPTLVERKKSADKEPPRAVSSPPSKASAKQKEAPAQKEPSTQKGPPKKVILGAAVTAGVLVLGLLMALLFSGDKGNLMVNVTAKGAEVRVGGQLVAQNTVVALPAGDYVVTVTAPGYLPVQQPVRIAKGQYLPVTPELKPEPPTEAESAPPAVSITTSPPKVESPKPTTFSAVFVGKEGAEIQVNGKPAGKMPGVKLANLTVGQDYDFTARRTGYKPYMGSFRSEGEAELKVRFDLEKEPPPTQVRAEPPPPKPQPQRTPPPTKVSTSKSSAKGKLACSTRPAGAQIFVNGKNTGRETPVALGNPLVLPVGTHTVVFKLGGKQSKPQKVNIREDDVTKLINVAVE
jgi:serine/threonine protein kinase